MHLWLLLFMASSAPPTEAPPVVATEARRTWHLDIPTLVWDAGWNNTWTTTDNPPRVLAPPMLGAPVLGPPHGDIDAIVVHLGDGGEVVFQVHNGDLIRITGPGTALLTRADDGSVTLQRPPQESGTSPQIGEIPAPSDFMVGGHGVSDHTLDRAPNGAESGKTFAFVAPRARAIVPAVDGDAPFTITWRHPEATRFDIEIAEVDSDDQVLATTERWWHIAGPSFRPWHPLEPGRRYRFSLSTSGTVSDNGAERTTQTLDTLSSNDIEQLRASLAGIADVGPTLGRGATNVLEALVFTSFGLDDDATNRWWFLFLTHFHQPRASEFAARALSTRW